MAIFILNKISLLEPKMQNRVGSALMGLDDVKASLEQAMAVLDVLVDDLSPALGEGLRAALEHTLRQPLRGRLEALEHLQATVDALAT